MNSWIPHRVPSKDHDCVLDRVIKYAEYHGVDQIWIDDDCINQDNPDEHEMAMQSMDLMYSSSQCPVGLLTKPVESQENLGLLGVLLRSSFLETSDHQHAPALIPRIYIIFSDKRLNKK